MPHRLWRRARFLAPLPLKGEGMGERATLSMRQLLCGMRSQTGTPPGP